MIRSMPPAARASAAKGRTSPRNAPPAGGFEYREFKIEIHRRDAKSVDVRAFSGDVKSEAVRVAFSKAETGKIHKAFRFVRTAGEAGSGLITQAEAIDLGKRLAEVLMPPPVFQLLGKGLADAVSRPRGALRLRLEMDGELAELPWEYLYRPDHRDGVSGFLLLDPRISLLRHVDRKQPELHPITGKQRLTFVGALWEGGLDEWHVRAEFELLRKALKPVSQYVWPDYGLGSDDEAFAGHLELGTAIFHYAGHCDFDDRGEAYLVREMPLSQSVHEAPKAYLPERGGFDEKARSRGDYESRGQGARSSAARRELIVDGMLQAAS